MGRKKNSTPKLSFSGDTFAFEFEDIVIKICSSVIIIIILFVKAQRHKHVKQRNSTGHTSLQGSMSTYSSPKAIAVALSPKPLLFFSFPKNEKLVNAFLYHVIGLVVY